MKVIGPLFFLIIIIFSCDDDNNILPVSQNERISAVDISSLPEILESNPIFYNLNGEQEEFISILSKNGINTIRLRLWLNPSNGHSSFKEVKDFFQSLKSQGLKTWACLHYSDTWADPGQQETPGIWKDLSFLELKDSVYAYTKRVVIEMDPDYIQIGNEINSGFLHPEGNINSNQAQFLQLLDTASMAVRTYRDECQIMMHYAGIDGSNSFYTQIKNIDYDIIGISYYPKWHGKSLASLETTLQNLSDEFDKDVLIAETAYPFTLEWNDQTHNIVGLNEQLILPEFPATPDRQRNFIGAMNDLSQEHEKIIGFCYWGAELIAWKGPQSTTASPWENQALFNFQNKALPVLQEF